MLVVPDVAVVQFGLLALPAPPPPAPPAPAEAPPGSQYPPPPPPAKNLVEPTGPGVP